MNHTIQFKMLKNDMQSNFRVPIGFLSCENVLLLEKLNFFAIMQSMLELETPRDFLTSRWSNEMQIMHSIA